MGMIDVENLLLPTALGSSRYVATTIATITSAAGAGNRKSAQLGKLWVSGYQEGDAAKQWRYLVYQTGAVTADAGAKLRTSIQGKAAGAFTPNGTILSAGVGANNAFSDDAIPAASSLITVDLGAANAPTIAHKAIISVVHEIDPDNVGTVASVVINGTSFASSATDIAAGSVSFSNPTWTQVPTALPNLVLIATDGTYARVGPVVGGSFTATAFASNSVGPLPTKVAAVFTSPFDMLVDGCHLGLTTIAAGAAFDIVMRDMAGVQIGNNKVSLVDTDVRGTAGYIDGFNVDGKYLFRRGAQIMYSLEPTNANLLTIGTITHQDAAANALQSMGAFVGLRYYIDGAWGAVDTLSRPAWNLIVSELHIPGAGTIGGGSFDSDIAVLRG